MLPTEEEKQKLLDALLKEVNESAPPRPIKQINNLHYIIALVVIVLTMVFGVITTLVYRPDIDPLIIFASIPVIGGPTILGLLTLMNSRESKINSKEAAIQSRDTHKMVNSRLKLWMDAAEKISFAAGLQEGIQRGTTIANERTDVLAKEPPPLASEMPMPVTIVGTKETIPVAIVEADKTVPVVIVDEEKKDK